MASKTIPWVQVGSLTAAKTANGGDTKVMTNSQPKCIIRYRSSANKFNANDGTKNANRSRIFFDVKERRARLTDPYPHDVTQTSLDVCSYKFYQKQVKIWEVQKTT